MIPCMLNMCYVGVILSTIAMIWGFNNLRKRDKATERYISRLEAENRRLKHAVFVLERKAKGDRMIYTLGAEEVNE